jgi:hypothetical protein
MGVSSDRGTVAVGKRADLLLLDADPLADITNTRRIAGVMASGRWLPRSELDRKLTDLVERYDTAALALPRSEPGRPIEIEAPLADEL